MTQELNSALLQPKSAKPLADIQVGDTVMIASNNYTRRVHFFVLTVDKVTSTQFSTAFRGKASSRRFKKDTGREIGGSSYKQAFVPTPEFLKLYEDYSKEQGRIEAARSWVCRMGSQGQHIPPELALALKAAHDAWVQENPDHEYSRKLAS